MFGLSWPELLLIGIVAIIAIGPKELPTVMRTLGRWARKGRAMADELRRHWEDIPNQAGLDDMHRQADDLQKKTFEKFGVKAPEDKSSKDSALPKDRNQEQR
jgi:sec-independent protein translocase protein TatB